jgi:YebC/PmpR family DNA-binding regulatory protein
MGRIFETRKATMFARWDRMSKLFSRLGKEVAIAVKKGGPDPANNPALRRVMQNARASNMPKDKIEAAIKKASGQGAQDFEEVLYEAYAPHGIALMIECATDNITRTAGNVRSILTRNGGNLGSTGSVGFQFKRMGVFRLKPEGIEPEALELEMIDHGLEEMGESSGEKGEPQLLLRCAFNDFGHLAKALEDKGITPVSSESEFIPVTPTSLPEGQANEVLALVDKLEQDEDVQRIFHNLG